MERLKGLILSGGAGTRLRPITHTSAKQLVPVANKPVLFYGIEALVDAGVTEIGIVIAPRTGDEIKAAVGDGAALGANVSYIPQAEPLGLAHAVLVAEEFIGSEPFVMYLGDNLLRDGIADLVDAFRADEPDALILLTPVSDPSSYGVAELAGERVVRLVEKPESPPSDLALVGVYMFSQCVFDAARAISPSPRGELEITDTIQRLIDDGRKVDSRRVKGWWKDTGQLEDILEANRLVLEEIKPAIDGELVDSRVEGRKLGPHAGAADWGRRLGCRLGNTPNGRLGWNCRQGCRPGPRPSWAVYNTVLSRGWGICTTRANLGGTTNKMATAHTMQHSTTHTHTPPRI